MISCRRACNYSSGFFGRSGIQKPDFPRELSASIHAFFAITTIIAKFDSRRGRGSNLSKIRVNKARNLTRSSAKENFLRSAKNKKSHRSSSCVNLYMSKNYFIYNTGTLANDLSDAVRNGYCHQLNLDSPWGAYKEWNHSPFTGS